MKMDNTKSPMDIVENWNVKPMRVSSQEAEKASSDGTTNKQCGAAHWQSKKTTVTQGHTDFADIPKPTLSQGPAVAAEEARTVGSANVQCRSNNQDYMKMTAMKLPTDFVKLTESTPSRVLPVVAEEAHTDGTRVVQCQSDDQNYVKTTITQMPMDFIEIPEPSLPRFFLELAKEARNVKVEIEQICYTDEVQTQEAGLTRPVFVTVMESSSSVLNMGAMIAPGISTERIPPRSVAGRRSPADQLDLVGPWNKTGQSVLSRSDTNDEGTDHAGPVGPDVSVDQSQAVAEGPVGQYITRSPVGSDGMLSTCDSDQPVADGPVGPSVSLGLVGPRRTLSQCKLDQPVADGPVGQSFTPDPVGPCGILSKCEPNNPIADSPVGSTETPDPVDERERPIQIDIMKIVTTDELASLTGTPPSSDSGVHSWGEQWENMSISTTDTEAERIRKPTIGIPTGRRVSHTCVPPKTEEDQVIICPWMNCLLNRESDESSSIGIRNYNENTQESVNMDIHSDRELTSDESSSEVYEGGAVVPLTALQAHSGNVAISGNPNSSVGSRTDGKNSDIGDLADFSSDEEESQVEQISFVESPVVDVRRRSEIWNGTMMTSVIQKIPVRGQSACRLNNII